MKSTEFRDILDSIRKHRNNLFSRYKVDEILICDTNRHPVPNISLETIYATERRIFLS